MLYWIAYDLDKPGQDYDKMVSALKALGAKKIMLSDWLLESAEEIEPLNARISRLVDTTDRYLIAQLTGAAAWDRLLTPDDEVRPMLTRAGVRTRV